MVSNSITRLGLKIQRRQLTGVPPNPLKINHPNTQRYITPPPHEFPSPLIREKTRLKATTIKIFTFQQNSREIGSRD